MITLAQDNGCTVRVVQARAHASMYPSSLCDALGGRLSIALLVRIQCGGVLSVHLPLLQSLERQKQMGELVEVVVEVAMETSPISGTGSILQSRPISLHWHVRLSRVERGHSDPAASATVWRRTRSRAPRKAHTRAHTSRITDIRNICFAFI